MDEGGSRMLNLANKYSFSDASIFKSHKGNKFICSICNKANNDSALIRVSDKKDKNKVYAHKSCLSKIEIREEE